MSDRDVAEKLNRKLACVRGRRTMLGRTAFGRALARLRYERESRDRYAELFASKSNAELRRILGWTDKRIRTRRRQLAAGHVRNRGPEWTIEEDQLLSTKPDEVIARLIGRPVRAVRSRRWQKRIRLRKGWRPEDDKILGDRIDKVTGLLLGRQAGNVSWRRRKLGIAAKGNRPWTPEEEALLGTRPDRELAREFRRTFAAVQAKRIQLGRPKPDARSKVIKVKGSAVPGSSKIQNLNVKARAAYCTWTPEEDALLGKITDQEIAARLGCSVRRVNLRRRRLGLHNPNPDHRHWTAEDIALLGTAPDSEISRKVNRSVGNVRYKRLSLGIAFSNPKYEVWKTEELRLLGKIPDEEVALQTGHSVESVRRARQKRGIASTKPVAPDWTKEEEALLGTAPDAEIASRLNRSLGAIRLRRINKGIPCWSAIGTNPPGSS